MMQYLEMKAIHVPQVADLEALCFSDPWPEQAVAGELTNDLSFWLVAVDGDRLAGYVGSQTVGWESDMMNIAVHPDFRRQGIAAALVEKLIRELNLRGSRSLTLEVRTSNTPAIAMYEKLGFQQVGLRKNYYRHPKEDARILRKEWNG